MASAPGLAKTHQKWNTIVKKVEGEQKYRSGLDLASRLLGGFSSMASSSPKTVEKKKKRMKKSERRAKCAASAKKMAAINKNRPKNRKYTVGKDAIKKCTGTKKSGKYGYLSKRKGNTTGKGRQAYFMVKHHRK